MSKILVVEHEESLRRFYELELAQEGDTVLSADDTAEAVNEFEFARPDLVVLDLGPPPNDGLLLVEKMFELDRTVPILLNTTCRSYTDGLLGWAVDAYVEKSPDTNELRSKVRELLHPVRTHHEVRDDR